MYFVYVLHSEKRDYWYVGMTNNVERRFTQHQKGRERTTRAYRPFQLVLVEEYRTRPEARNREKYLKSSGRKGRLKSQYAQMAKLVDALA